MRHHQTIPDVIKTIEKLIERANKLDQTVYNLNGNEGKPGYDMGEVIEADAACQYLKRLCGQA